MRVTPAAPRSMSTKTALLSDGSTRRAVSESPAWSRYHCAARSTSDTMTMTPGVVGAARRHGPRAAWAAPACTAAIAQAAMRSPLPRCRRRCDRSNIFFLPGSPGALHLDFRCLRIDLAELLAREFDFCCAQVLFQAMHLPRAGDRDDPGLLREQPSERDLRTRRIPSCRDVAEQIE